MPKRQNGQGSIYFDKSKNRYAASFISPLGKRIVKRFQTKEQAENWLEDNRYQIRHNTFVTPTQISLGKWLLQYIETYKSNVRPATLSLYISCLKRLAPIADIPLQKLTGVEIQNLINKYEGEISSTYIKKIYQLLNMALKKAVALELISKSPLVTVERPKVVTKKIQIYTIEEIHTLLDYTKGKRKRLYMEILLAVYTGMRIGEILSLTWADISPSYVRINKTLASGIHGTLFVQKMPKTEKSNRLISIPPSLYDELMAYKEHTRADEGLVFKSRKGTLLFPYNERTAFQKVQAELGILPIRGWHALRHTHASQLLANGVPIAEVSKRLGHSSPAVTLGTYTSWIPGNDEKVALDVDRIFK